MGDAFEAIAGEDSFGGDDTIDGGEGDDLILGDASFIADGATGGADTLIGGADDDTIYGDGFEIDADSFAGDDNLTGGAGNDHLWGDAETLDGEAGEDTFVFDTGTSFGDDFIEDAGAGGATDTISFSGVASIAALDARSSVGEGVGNVIAVVYTDASMTTQAGFITIVGIGDGSFLWDWAKIDTLATINVAVA